MKTRSLYVAWQDKLTRAWFPIGKLMFDGLKFRFVYTKGVIEARQQCGFESLQSFPDIYRTYESEKLFPVFSNRVLSPSREDYPSFVDWCDLSRGLKDPVALLSRSGGERETDALQVFPIPEPENGQYQIHFFAHGIRHCEGASKRIEGLSPGDPLQLVPELDNPQDPLAIKLVAEDSPIGYCPRFIVKDLHKLQRLCEKDIRVSVEKVNPAPTPVQFRLLCRLVSPWPNEFQPFSEEHYGALAPKVAA
ncbi:MAG: DNA-binding protein [Candidatus Melainabacteria bacterium]|nr:DNA-binding protein [Candidatus Melainabacteria bacterium]